MKKSFLTAVFAFLFAVSGTAQPSLQEKIGQMLMVGVPNFNTALDTLMDDITLRNLGGILYFGYNIQNRDQILALNEDLQMMAPTPLFLATDQEGGLVARLRPANGYPSTWSANYTGNVLGIVDSTRSQAGRMAFWMTDAGLNVNLAPVVDVNVDPLSPAIGGLNRSYNSDPNIVADHAIAFIAEFSARNVITALKHFPGHGSARDDSHFGFTDITTTWQPYELTPYSRIMAEFQPDMVMTGHLFHQDWDPDYPASISHYAIQHVLRDSLGFTGVVISDEMFMRAIRDNYTLDDAVVLAINAGTDILLFNTNLCSTACNREDAISISRYIIDLVSQKVDEGVIAESRIDEAFARISALKTLRIPVSVGYREMPLAMELDQNYPNPFNPSTVIRFIIGRQEGVRGKVDGSSAGQVRLSVYDVLGREVAVLVNEILPPGEHRVLFDASSLASGMYIYRLQTSEGSLSRKMTLLK